MLAHLAELNAAVQAAHLEPLPAKPLPEDRFLRWGHGEHAWLIWSHHRTSAGEPYILASFGSWRSGDKHHWCSLGDRLSPDLRLQVKEDWARLDREARERQAQRQAIAKQVAAQRFAAADPHGYSPYLERKTGAGRADFDLRVEADGTLLIPVLDWEPDGTLSGQSLQAIAPTGEKKFQPGGKVRGGFYVIGWPIVNGNPFAVCEGVATGISLHQATRLPVVCTFSAGNLAPVMAGLRAHYPDNPIVVCADNDRWTPGNPGLTAARALIDPYRVAVRYPEFGEDAETAARKPTDFNDLARREDLGGLAMVYQQVLGQPVYEAPRSEPGPDPEPDPNPASPEGIDIHFTPAPGSQWRVVPDADPSAKPSPSTEQIVHEALVAPGERKRPAQSHVARQLADALRSQLAWDDPQQVWREYRGGYWKVIPRSTVNRLVQRAMDDVFTDGYSDSYVAGAIHLMSNYLAVDDWNPQAQTALPMDNGVLDLTSRTLRPHRPEDRWTWQLPFSFNPIAQPGPVVDWLLTACDGHADRVEVLRAWLQATLLGRTDLQRYLELIGAGGSGKSTFLSLMEALIGSANIQTTELKHLEGRFETAGLLGKRLLMVTDQQQYSGEVSVLKSIVGQDRVRIEHKYQAGITSERIPALVVIAANFAIRASDYSSGMERRRIFMPFNQLVAAADRRDLPREFQPYLPGVLNWALALPAERVTELLRDTLTHTPSLADPQTEYQALVNPLLTWAQEELTVDPQAFAPWGLAQKNRSRDGDCEFLNADQFLYANYSEFCATHGLQRLSSVRFQSAAMDLLRAQLRLDVLSVRCFSGVHRNRHGVRGIRLAKAGDPPLIPDRSPNAPVAPAHKFSTAQATHGFTKQCASAPVAPTQTTSHVSAAKPAYVPSEIDEKLRVITTDATGALAQKEKDQVVKCASSVFGTGAPGATPGTAAPAGAWPRAFDLEDGWEAMVPLLARATGFSEADLLAGNLDTDDEWGRYAEGIKSLSERYLSRTQDLAALSERIDQAFMRRTGN